MSPRVRWTLAIASLLLLTGTVQGTAIVLALLDPSFAVEPDYEAKAARFDEVLTQRARNERLGWSAALTTRPAGAQVAISVALTAPDGSCVSGAGVTLETFHLARAARVLAARLVPTADGRYAAVLPMDRSGIWEFRLAATRGADRFTAVLRQEVSAPVRRGGP